ncbi:hypothetical protein BTUL_0002g00390 [Botrytis tulipae]|uniref:Uncharacterized protein n=1 Tax=Botrytis tulipae TaxID=87230 RepID=A0A4Z1F602_9HELO|nr:hypothetical protein BTUL_0002g00390 [Botrytis tulipae]
MSGYVHRTSKSLLNMYKKHPIPRSKFVFLPQTTSACNIPRFPKEPSEILQTDPLTKNPQTPQIKPENIMPRILTQAICLLVALIYACFISIVLLPIFLVFNGLPIHPGELFGALRGLLAERLPRARDAPDDELPEARRDWVVSRHEIMMGREFQIAQYRGFLHELHERAANRAANNGRVIAPPEVVDDSSSEEEFDVHDYDMSLP